MSLARVSLDHPAVGTFSARRRQHLLRSRWGLAVALLIWVALIAGLRELPLSGLALLCVQAAGLLLLMLPLAQKSARPLMRAIFVWSLLIFSAQILVVKSLPQWQDSNPDAVTYDRQAQALVKHWRGETVPAKAWRLQGLHKNGITEWLPADERPYRVVFGMGRYFYPLYLAGVYWLTGTSTDAAILGNAAFLAAAAAVTYLLALELFGAAIGRVAVALMVLDTNFAAIGSILMRDALIVLLTVLALLCAARLAKAARFQWVTVLYLALAGACLAVVRFNVLGALALAAGVVAVKRAGHRGMRRVMARGLPALVLVTAGAGLLWFAVPSVRQPLESSLAGQVIQENLAVLSGSTLAADALAGRPLTSRDPVDDARKAWYASLRERPLWLNLATAAARTLFAPNPWHILLHGFSGKFWYELMIPGTALWIALLPVFGVGLAVVPVRKNPAVLGVLIWLAAVTVFYILGFGEFSGRARTMAAPVLWTFVACGWVQLGRRFRAMRRLLV